MQQAVLCWRVDVNLNGKKARVLAALLSSKPALFLLILLILSKSLPALRLPSSILRSPFSVLRLPCFLKLPKLI